MNHNDYLPICLKCRRPCGDRGQPAAYVAHTIKRCFYICEPCLDEADDHGKDYLHVVHTHDTTENSIDGERGEG